MININDENKNTNQAQGPEPTPIQITQAVEIQEVNRLNFAARILSLFMSPGKLMANIRAYPLILQPLAMVILISILSLPIATQYVEIVSEQLSILSIEHFGVDYFDMLNIAQDTAAMPDAVLTAANVISVISVVAGVIIMMLLSTLGLFIIAKIAKSPQTFTHYFSMFAHLSILSTLGVLAVATIGVAIDTWVDVTSLAAILMPGGDVTQMLYNVLASINLFGLWVAILVIIGLKELNEWTYTRAIVAGTIFYALSVAISAVIMWWSFAMLNILATQFQ